MRDAGIARKKSVTWNVVPWWYGMRKVAPAKLREGAECAKQLAGLLPKLRAIILVGKKAAKACP